MSLFLLTTLKFWYTIAVVFVLTRLIYYANKGKKEYLFTCLLLSAIIYLICVLIRRVELSIGFAIGIFAIFGVIRYRTQAISVREMTYIFLAAGIAAKNALVPEELGFLKLMSTDISLLLLAGISEFFLFRKSHATKIIVYNNLELIHPEKRSELYEDLRNKYGIFNITKIRVGKIDSVKSSVRLLVSYKDSDDSNFEEDLV